MSRTAAIIHIAAAALLTFLILPYFWARAVSLCILMDFGLKTVPWTGGFVLLIVIVATLMHKLDVKSGIRPFRWITVVVLFLIWSSLITTLMLLATSPFRERLPFIPVIVLSTLWVIWLWIMPMTALRRSVRSVVFVIFLLLAPAYPVLMTFDGLDGDMHPILMWRFAVQEPPSTSGRVQPKSTSKSIQLDTADIPAFPQFLGPKRNGVVTGMNLSKDMKTHPPQERWRHIIGLGWSGFATQANRAVTQEQRGKREMIVCYELLTGDELWNHSDNTLFHSIPSGDGPRATPTIVNRRVYSVGATGQLNCLELATGKLLWTVNILKDNDAENLLYGQTCSPLVVDQLVIVSPGGGNGKSVVAYEKDTGKAVWRSGNDGGGYGTPTLATIADVRQILMFNATGLASHDFETGTILWTHPWQNPPKTNCTQPVLVADGENRILLSTGYGLGSCMIELNKSDDNSFAVKQLWMSRELRASFSSILVRENYAYGLDSGTLVCIDLVNGKQKWKGNRYGHGQVLLVDDLLIVQAERGQIAFVQANPESFSELYRMNALNSKTWNNPALAGRFLLVRNNREAVCYELSQEM